MNNPGFYFYFVLIGEFTEFTEWKFIFINRQIFSINLKVGLLLVLLWSCFSMFSNFFDKFKKVIAKSIPIYV